MASSQYYFAGLKVSPSSLCSRRSVDPREIANYSHWGPPSTNAPYSYETCVFKFLRICGSSGQPVVHNIYKFSINRPVLSCLFLSSLKRTQGMRFSPHPPPHNDGSLLCLSSRSFLPAGSPLPITYVNLGRLEVGALQ